MIVRLNVIRVQRVQLKGQNFARVCRRYWLLLEFDMLLHTELILAAYLDTKFNNSQCIASRAIVPQSIVEFIAQASMHYKLNFQVIVIIN